MSSLVSSVFSDGSTEYKIHLLSVGLFSHFVSPTIVFPDSSFFGSVPRLMSRSSPPEAPSGVEGSGESQCVGSGRGLTCDLHLSLEPFGSKVKGQPEKVGSNHDRPSDRLPPS